MKRFNQPPFAGGMPFAPRPGMPGMPMQGQPQGPFPGQPQMPFPQGHQAPKRPPMMQQPFPQGPQQPPMFGQMPYGEEPEQITIQEVQQEVQPAIQHGMALLSHVAMVSYLMGLGYTYQDALQLVESYIR